MLIIGLPHDPLNDTCTQVLSDDGLRVLGTQVARPESATPHESVMAIIPHTRLSWHAVRIPPVSRSQRQAAAVGLLEDLWLQPAHELHLGLFPIPDAEPDRANLWVCACDAAWLRQVLQPWVDLGRAPQKIVPEFAPTEPGHVETLHWLGTEEHGTVVWCRPQGVLAAQAPPPWPLLASTPVESWAEPSALEKARQFWGEETQIQTRTQAERWLQATASPFDLALGEWSQTPWQQYKRRAIELLLHIGRHPSWRPARLALGAVVAIQCVGLLSWSWWTEQALQAQREELKTILIQTFPQTTLVVDAPLQMQQGVHRWRQSLGEPHPGQPEVMLTHLSNIAPNLQAIRFEGQVLTLKGPTLSSLKATDLQRLHALGYTLKATSDGLSMSWEENR